jgi:dsRNA-specific ribonuclease
MCYFLSEEEAANLDMHLKLIHTFFVRTGKNKKEAEQVAAGKAFLALSDKSISKATLSH